MDSSRITAPVTVVSKEYSTLYLISIPVSPTTIMVGVTQSILKENVNTQPLLNNTGVTTIKSIVSHLFNMDRSL